MAKKKTENEPLKEPPEKNGETEPVLPPEPKEVATPKSNNNPNPPLQGKKRILHESLKNETVIVFDGTAIAFDETGTAVVEDKYADYLLQIPAYSEVKA